jgi:Cd2+/Zn2+-exporting ATPase
MRAHVERDKSPVDLCLHYDPNLLTLSDVKRLAERAGAQIINRFHHESIRHRRHGLFGLRDRHRTQRGRMDGVLSVNVNYPAEKMWIEYDNQK